MASRGVITGGERQQPARGGHRRNSFSHDGLKLVNWPITGPMFTRPQQNPSSPTAQFGLQQRSTARWRPPAKVSDSDGATIGHNDCSIDTFVTCLYRASNNAWKTLPPATPTA